MADLGKTTNGSGEGNTTGVWWATQYTAPDVGTGDTVYIRCRQTSTNAQLIVCVWADTGADYPGTLLTNSAAFTPASSTEGVETIAVTQFEIANGTKYWLGGLGNSVSASIVSRADSGGLSYFKSSGGAFTAANFPAGATAGVRLYDLYVPIEAVAPASTARNLCLLGVG